MRNDFINTRQIFAGESDIKRAHIFLQVSPAFGSGNRNDIVALCQDPRERELRWRAFLFASDFTDSLD